MAEIVKTIETDAERIAEVQTEKILLMYVMCEIINEIAREVEVDLDGMGKFNYSELSASLRCAITDRASTLSPAM